MVAVAAAAAVLVAAGAAGWLQRRSAREPRWTPGRTRPLEARLSDARADVYRPFEPPRGTGATPMPDYRLLEHLQRRENRRGLASLLLQMGLRGQADALLGRLPPAELVRRHPDRVRLDFYQALAETTAPEGWTRLAEMAALLDGHYGGRTLRDHVGRLGRLPPRRSREIAEREWALIGSPGALASRVPDRAR
jgi:hypothetical protein